jgi:hypothetical protein
MKKIINLFLILYIFLLPSPAAAKTIKETINLPMLDDCFYGSLLFNNYKDCFLRNLKTTDNISKKKLNALIDLYELFNILNLAVEDNYILNADGKLIVSDIYDHPFSQKYKKVKLAKATEETGCSLAATFEEFINCFYLDFRNLNVYRTSSIQTKIQMETIMYNSLKLLDEKNIVIVIQKNDLKSVHSKDYNVKVDKGSLTENTNGPFEFFYQEMDKVGTSLFDKIKENEDEIKRVLTLIVISIVVGMIVQKVIIKSAVGGGGGGGGQLSYSGGQASSGSSGAGSYLFSNAPAGSVLQKRWFRYGVAKGFF